MPVARRAHRSNQASITERISVNKKESEMVVESFGNLLGNLGIHYALVASYQDGTTSVYSDDKTAVVETLSAALEKWKQAMLGN